MVLGMLEIFALFSLMLKSFRFPYVEYLREIGIIAAVVTLVSYLIRVYFEIFQVVDIVTHLILYIMFFRYIFKIRYWRALIISFTYLGYIVIVLAVYVFYTSTNILTPAVLQQPNGIAAYLIQLTSAAVTFLISYLIYRSNTGFGFISVPPHDFLIKNKLGRQDLILICSGLIVVVIVFLALFFIFHTKTYMSILLIIISYITLVFVAYRRDLKL
jgi:hypothetical protein